jgi:hypothetical protein
MTEMEKAATVALIFIGLYFLNHILIDFILYSP